MWNQESILGSHMLEKCWPQPQFKERKYKCMLCQEFLTPHHSSVREIFSAPPQCWAWPHCPLLLMERGPGLSRSFKRPSTLPSALLSFWPLPGEQYHVPDRGYSFVWVLEWVGLWGRLYFNPPLLLQLLPRLGSKEKNCFHKPRDFVVVCYAEIPHMLNKVTATC